MVHSLRERETVEFSEAEEKRAKRRLMEEVVLVKLTPWMTTCQEVVLEASERTVSQAAVSLPLKERVSVMLLVQARASLSSVC